MKYTDNYNLKKPEPTDFYNVEDFNDNMDIIDSQLTQMTQKAHEIITVGDNADFSNLNEALEELSKRHARYWQEGYTAEILLASGFVMQEQVMVEGVDLGWITISAESSVVNVDMSKLTKSFENSIQIPLFGAYKNATLPIINALFDMGATSRHSGKTGVFLSTNSRATILDGAGVINAGEHGLFVFNNSFASARNTVFDGAKGNGIYVQHSSTINADGASAKNAGERGVFANYTANINAGSFDASGAGINGVYVAAASRMNFNGGKARIGSSDSNNDIVVAFGGIISANTSTGGTNVTPNQLTANGIIFK